MNPASSEQQRRQSVANIEDSTAPATPRPRYPRSWK